MQIILIDDDPDTHDFMSIYLESEGFKIHPAYSGAEGLQLAQDQDPDLVILDIQLPHMNGWDICRNIRSFSDVPILMISAVARSESDIEHGLNIGADDYITKPIRPRILKARVNALLRRSQHTAWRESHEAYIDTHLKIDLRRSEVTVQGKRVSLSFLEYRLLELLVRNADRSVPTVEIIEELWSENVDETYAAYVRIYIRRLRKIIEPDARFPLYIVTDHGLGYRFEPQV